MKFYTVDNSYVEQLYKIDTEVFYEPYNYSTKPYIGIITQNNGYSYFIPLTSAKPKHKTWSNVSKTNYIIYEMLPSDYSYIPDDWIYCRNKHNLKHILSVLEIKKMIPVPEQFYSEIKFKDITDNNYRSLLLKEYNFLKPLQNTIFQKAEAFYLEQKTSGIIVPYACNFNELEQVYNGYTKELITL